MDVTTWFLLLFDVQQHDRVVDGFSSDEISQLMSRCLQTGIDALQ